MSISSYYDYTCTFPKDTEFDKAVMNVEDKGDRWEIYDEGDGAYSETCLEELVEVFGKPLDKVPGLELDLYYECHEDGFWKMELDIMDGKCTYRESEIHMVEHPMSDCPVDIAIGTPEGNVREAKKIWKRLGETPVDDNECIERHIYIPRTCYYAEGTHREEIWHDIEEKYGVSVAWLMGQAKNPDGTNE